MILLCQTTPWQIRDIKSTKNTKIYTETYESHMQAL